MITRPVLSSQFPQFGMGIAYPCPGIIERVGLDWDFIWADGQHGQFGYQDLIALVRAGDHIGRPVLVRVASHGYGEIGQALDMGAAGIVVPCVDTPDHARAIVQAGKFPPVGGRSYGSRRMVDLTGRNYSDTANATTKLIAQIETPEAMANVDAIAAVPGIDVLFLGPDDLLMRRGVRMDAPRTLDTLRDDLQRVADACQRHGKLAMTVGGSVEIAMGAVRMGYHFLVGGGDMGFLTTGSKKASTDLRTALGGK